jgi:hypothetical protein
MSAAVATKVIQHALDVAQIYKDNATLTRGLPQAQPRLTIADLDYSAPKEPVEPVKGEQGPPGKDADAALIIDEVLRKIGSSNQSGTQATLSPSANKSNDFLKNALWGLLLTSGLGAGVAGGKWYYSQPITINEQAQEDKLLADLQERAYHLPPEKRLK